MARSALKSLTGVLIFLSLFSLFTPQIVWSASDGDKITVEAEGIGATKMEALKSAWQEAVRSAVGMYMAGKTEVLNDNITEEIASYSRGQIDSFKILSESEDNGAWRIRIRANVDRDILKETIAPSQSQTVGVDGASLAAQLQGDIDKGKDASDVAKISDLFNFYNCLDYQAYPQRYNVGGKNYIIVQHVLRMNPNKFQKQAKELEKYLGQIAISKKNVSVNKDCNPNKAISIASDPKFSLKLTDATIKDCFREGGKYIYNDMSDGFNPFNCFFDIYDPDQYNIGIVKNTSTGVSYRIPDSLKSILKEIKKYRLKFHISTGDGFDSINEASKEIAISYSPIIGWRAYFAPQLCVYGEVLLQTPAIVMLQPLNVSPEQLANVKGFTCRFTLDPINH